MNTEQYETIKNEIVDKLTLLLLTDEIRTNKRKLLRVNNFRNLLINNIETFKKEEK